MEKEGGGVRWGGKIRGTSGVRGHVGRRAVAARAASPSLPPRLARRASIDPGASDQNGCVIGRGAWTTESLVGSAAPRRRGPPTDRWRSPCRRTYESERTFAADAARAPSIRGSTVSDPGPAPNHEGAHVIGGMPCVQAYAALASSLQQNNSWTCRHASTPTPFGLCGWSMSRACAPSCPCLHVMLPNHPSQPNVPSPPVQQASP